MNKIWTILMLAGIIISSNSCDNEVVLSAEFKDIPVAYGLLSRQDSVHYIRIEKAFLDENNGNALEIAQIGDSLYYENLDVSVERFSTGDSYSLTRINGNDEGLVKEDGIFANDPNYLYKFILPNGEELVGGEDYELQFNRGDNKPLVTASTTIVDDFNFIIPATATELNIRYRPFPISWRREAGAVFYDMKMLIYILEEQEDGTFDEISLQWDIEEGIIAEGSNTVSYDFDGEGFYIFLGAELDEIDGRQRIFSSIDLIIDAGSQEIFDYINIGQANTGITSSQIIPTYSNLSEGFGIFGSRNRTVLEGFSLKSEARDSLANGIYTSGLGFEF